MKKKYFYILILLIIFNCTTAGQTYFTLFTGISYNNFSMGELRGLQKELFRDLIASNIQAKIVDDFQGYYGFKGGILIPTRRGENYIFSLGGLFEHTSTGGRIHYGDYSGEIKADQIINATSFGIILNYGTTHSKNFKIDYQLSVSYFYSSFTNSFYSRIGNNIDAQDLEFSSSSFGLLPGIVPSFKIWNLSIGLSLSYLIYIPSTLEYNRSSEAYLINKNGDKVNIDWSGIRTGFQIGIEL